MQILDTSGNSLPMAQYIKLAGQLRPFVPIGSIETGGLTGKDWTDILSWLSIARRNVAYEMRKNPPAKCEQAIEGEHDWSLIESGCERTWNGVGVTNPRPGRTEVLADSGREDSVSDGEDYYLMCRTCMAEANCDEVDFI